MERQSSKDRDGTGEALLWITDRCHLTYEGKVKVSIPAVRALLETGLLAGLFFASEASPVGLLCFTDRSQHLFIPSPQCLADPEKWIHSANGSLLSTYYVWYTVLSRSWGQRRVRCLPALVRKRDE